MSVVVACHDDALVEVSRRLRDVADQVESRDVDRLGALQGNAFDGARPSVRASFEELCADGGRAEGALAAELRELAGAVDAARELIQALDASLSRSLAGFVS